MNESEQGGNAPERPDVLEPDVLEKVQQTAEAGQRVTIRTGARLHFGLLDTAAPFGGAGVMIDQPATQVVVDPSASFQCDAAIADRTQLILERILKRLGLTRRPSCRILVPCRASAHAGLGSGTQLSLAIAEGLCRHLGWKMSESEIGCQLAARGKRSAVGVHGYFHGGLIHESSDRACQLNPVRQHVTLPTVWRVGFFVPRESASTVSGDLEAEKFARLASSAGRQRADLDRVLVEQLLPAADAGHFEAFATAVQTYNRLSGGLFAPVQGGPYNGPAVTALVQALRSAGATGVGQSSWGPGVFTWFASPESASRFMRRIPADLAAQGMITTVQNQPRQMTVGN